MKIIFYICLVFLLCTFAFQCITPKVDFALEPGDLLFQDLDGSPFCDAVEKVTFGYNGANLTHVGIVIKDSSNKLVVLEALSRGVCITPIDAFLSRSIDKNQNPKVIVGRLKEPYQHLIPHALVRANAFIDKPYDFVFDIKNDSYYCSELVYLSFLDDDGENSLFELQPMTFIDPDTRITFPAWTDYYLELGEPIPEGKPGLNPGGISRSSVLDIVHVYGKLGGLN